MIQAIGHAFICPIQICWKYFWHKNKFMRKYPLIQWIYGALQMEYYINGEQVTKQAAFKYFEVSKMSKGYFDEQFTELEQTEEGRDIIGDITDFQLEIIADEE